MKLRMILGLGVALTFAGVLEHNRGTDEKPIETGIVYVYFPSTCTIARDASTCMPVAGFVRPAFESMAACFAHADQELARLHDPRTMASCMKEREA